MLRPFLSTIPLLAATAPDADEEAQDAQDAQNAKDASKAKAAPSYDEILRQRPEAKDFARQQVQVKDQAFTSQPGATAQERSNAGSSGASVALAIALGAAIVLIFATTLGYLMRRRIKHFLYLRGLIDDPY